ncbi:MAG: hypothetical protein B6242_02920 [Anaerolineaceae bacterium 4572_78]|nr:MAG: hypothetical protein B6242_02920 [Anaerolineaceae bacterium 4572_78]
MYNFDANQIRKKIRYVLWFFIGGLLLSGLTAFPLVVEVEILNSMISYRSHPRPREKYLDKDVLLERQSLL